MKLWVKTSLSWHRRRKHAKRLLWVRSVIRQTTWTLRYPGLQRPLKERKNGTSGSATTRPRYNTSCSASFWYSHLLNIFGQLKCIRTSTTATTDGLQPLTVRGDQIISEKQRPIVLRAWSLTGVKIIQWSPGQILLIRSINISVPCCIKLTFMLFVLLDD